MAAPSALTHPVYQSGRPAASVQGRTYTFALADAEKLIVTRNDESVTISLPPQSAVEWEADALLQVAQIGEGAITIDPGIGVDVHVVADDLTMSAQYGQLTLKRLAENEWLLTKFGEGVMGATSFLGLNDTPGNYTGDDKRLVVVDGDHLSFRDVSVALADGVEGIAYLGINTEDASASAPFWMRGPLGWFERVDVADGGTGSVTVGISKEDATKAANIAFVTGSTIRARIGTMFDDDWRIRVSPDGTSFIEALAADYQTGAIDITEPEVTVASATTCDIGAAASLSVVISGTTTITSFGTAANRLRFIRFSGILTLTHNGTSLILPGAANITTAAGDCCYALSDASGNWRIRSYTRAAVSPDFVSKTATGAQTILSPLIAPAGSLAAPALAVGAANNGLYLDGSNLRIGVGGAVGFSMTSGGFFALGPGWADGSSTPTDLIDIYRGANAIVNLYSETGAATFRATRGSANASGPSVALRKTRGASKASPADVVQNDALGVITAEGYAGSGFRSAYTLTVSAICATPSATDMEAREVLSLAAAGSVSPTEIRRFDHATGFSMYGANVVIDQNRRFVQGSPSEYTAANIASAAHAVNTTNKRVGLLVWDTTNNRMMRARAAGATDIWDVVDGSASVTPS